MVIIDEIGKMECLSDQFKKLISGLFDSEKQVIATIALKGSGFIEEVKRRQDIKLFELTQGNRDSLLSDILKEVGTVT
jgi:nucleoside-triphosphatase